MRHLRQNLREHYRQPTGKPRPAPALVLLILAARAGPPDKRLA